MRGRNIAAAVGLIVFGLVYGTLSWWLPERSLPNTPGPSFFPLVVTAVLLALSAALLLQGLALPREAAAPAAAARKTDTHAALLALGALLAYAVLLPTLGFVLATVPFFAVLMVLYGERRPLAVLVGAIVVTAALYGIFRHGFGVFLPRGLLAGIVA